MVSICSQITCDTCCFSHIQNIFRVWVQWSASHLCFNSGKTHIIGLFSGQQKNCHPPDCVWLQKYTVGKVTDEPLVSDLDSHQSNICSLQTFGGVTEKIEKAWGGLGRMTYYSGLHEVSLNRHVECVTSRWPATICPLKVSAMAIVHILVLEQKKNQTRVSHWHLIISPTSLRRLGSALTKRSSPLRIRTK